MKCVEVAVIGGGSLGLMWTARLLEVGCKVTLIVRSEEQRARLLSDGLRYIDVSERKCYAPVVHTYEQFLGDLPSWTLLTVKQRDIKVLLPFLERHLPKDGVVMTLQNGMGHFELLSSVLPKEKIVLGTTSDGALRKSVNEVQRTGYGQVWIGQANRVAPHTIVEKYLHHFQALGIIWEWEENILHRLWRKCIINSVINPLTALFAVENGKLLHSRHIIKIMRNVYDEGVAVAQADGMEFPNDLWQEIEEICRITSTNRSSMLQDLDRRGRTEVDFINGYIVKRGNEMKVPTPWNEMLVQLIHGKEDFIEAR